MRSNICRKAFYTNLEVLILEVWKILGIESSAKFKGDNGEYVPGIRLHLARDAELGSGLTGQEVRNQFISNQAVQKYQIRAEVGKMITFEFNRFGNICKVEVT